MTPSCDRCPDCSALTVLPYLWTPVVDQMLSDGQRPQREIRVFLRLLPELSLIEYRPITATVAAHVANIPLSSAARALRHLVRDGYLVRGQTEDGRAGLRLPLSRKRAELQKSERPTRVSG